MACKYLSDEDIERKIEEYREEIIKYQFTITSLITLKEFFTNFGFKVHIEPEININGKKKTPDLIVFIDDRMIAFDHKYIRRNKKCEYVSKMITELTEYIGTASYTVRENNVIANILDVVLLIPSHSWKNILHCTIELRYISRIVYKVGMGELLFENIKLNQASLTMLSHSAIDKRKSVPIPSSVYLYYFLREDPPLPYLLVRMYELALSLTSLDPFKEESTILLRDLKEALSKRLPRWITTGGYTADQLTDGRFYKFIDYLRKLNIGEVKGGLLYIKKPRDKRPDVYILTKLAQLELCGHQKQRLTEFE